MNFPAIAFGPMPIASLPDHDVYPWGVSPDGVRVWSVHRVEQHAVRWAAALRGGGPVPMHAANGFGPGAFVRMVDAPAIVGPVPKGWVGS